MTFTDTVLAETAPLCAAIREMPFNRALTEGTLAPEIFRHYVIQDAHYLEGFARALALAAARAPDAAGVRQLAQSAAGAIAVERQLHDHYMGLYGVSPADFAATPPTPVCEHYVSYLIATAATRGVAEAVAALLPCFWVYRDVGRAIHARATPDNPYQAWIDTYSGADFDAAVTAACTLADRLSDLAGTDERQRMKAAFAKSALLEWMFWDSAWRQAEWPDPAGTNAAPRHSSAGI